MTDAHHSFDQSPHRVFVQSPHGDARNSPGVLILLMTGRWTVEGADDELEDVVAFNKGKVHQVGTNPNPPFINTSVEQNDVNHYNNKQLLSMGASWSGSGLRKYDPKTKEWTQTEGLQLHDKRDFPPPDSVAGTISAIWNIEKKTYVTTHDLRFDMLEGDAVPPPYTRYSFCGWDGTEFTEEGGDDASIWFQVDGQTTGMLESYWVKQVEDGDNISYEVMCLEAGFYRRVKDGLSSVDPDGWVKLGAADANEPTGAHRIVEYNNQIVAFGDSSGAGSTFSIIGIDDTVWTRISQDVIRDIAVFRGDLIVVGGWTTLDGGAVNANYVAKWNIEDGFTQMGSGFNGGAWSVIVTKGGQLYVGGQFTENGNGDSVKHFARWDGSDWVEAVDKLESVSFGRVVKIFEYSGKTK